MGKVKIPSFLLNWHVSANRISNAFIRACLENKLISDEIDESDMTD